MDEEKDFAAALTKAAKELDDIAAEQPAQEPSPEPTTDSRGSEPDINTEPAETAVEEEDKEEKKEDISIPKYRFDEVARELRETKALIQELKKGQEPKEEEDDLDPATLELIKKGVKKLGLLTKEEASQLSYDQIIKQQEDVFLKEHPEYNSDSDLRGRLLAELSYYNTKPTDPTQYREKVLERVHQTLSPAKDTNESKVRAKLQRERTASLGSGGGATKVSPKEPALSQAEVDYYRNTGWSNETIEKYFGVKIT